MQELFQMYREYNDKRFDEVMEDLHEIQSKLSDINTFKAELLASSKVVSTVVSIVCGVVTLLVTTFLSLKTK